MPFRWMGKYLRVLEAHMHDAYAYGFMVDYRIQLIDDLYDLLSGLDGLGRGSSWEIIWFNAVWPVSADGDQEVRGGRVAVRSAWPSKPPHHGRCSSDATLPPKNPRYLQMSFGGPSAPDSPCVCRCSSRDTVSDVSSSPRWALTN
jgi:hypothetical protein